LGHFKSSILVTLIGLSAAYAWSGTGGLLMAAILGIMEISLSFDNAVVNATVLRGMNTAWQRRFLTWGMLIAVFGVRFLLPVVIVAVATQQSLEYVTGLALENPEEYAREIESAHVQISAFGGMYLLLVFLSFFFAKDKAQHWLGWMERRLSDLGKLESIEVVIALLILLAAQRFLVGAERLEALVAGILGVIAYVLVKSVSNLFDETGQTGKLANKSGLVAFIYLELLDLSFSLDGVIGAFAVTKDVVIILLGLTIGAMFVRSLTLFLVRKRLLEEYLYLEHGAHYAIGALAMLMLVDISLPVPETLTGLVGISFILLSLLSSIRQKRKSG
jgi:uncharacterized protein